MPVPAPDLGTDPTDTQLLRAAAEVCRAEAVAQGEPKLNDQAHWFDQVADQTESPEADGRPYERIGVSTAREILGLDPDSSRYPPEQHALEVRFTLRSADAAAGFDKLVGQTLEGIHNEPGTVTYEVFESEDEPLIRTFHEVYRDRAAFEEHEAQPHTQRFLVEREQYLERFEVTYLNTDRPSKVD